MSRMKSKLSAHSLWADGEPCSISYHMNSKEFTSICHSWHWSSLCRLSCPLSLEKRRLVPTNTNSAFHSAYMAGVSPWSAVCFFHIVHQIKDDMSWHQKERLSKHISSDYMFSPSHCQHLHTQNYKKDPFPCKQFLSNEDFMENSVEPRKKQKELWV